MRRLQAPFTAEQLCACTVGEPVLLSGTVYTARDAAHKRMIEMLERGEPLPFDIRQQAVFYAGPCPTPPGRVIGSIGPTTSGRMDAYTPRLIAEGLCVMIGKGARNEAVVAAIRRYSGLYLAAVGGAAAWMAHHVKENEVIAFEDLGTEAIRRLVFRDLPLMVAVDTRGIDLYRR